MRIFVTKRREPVAFGLDVCCRPQFTGLDGARFGLLMNRGSVDTHMRLACDALAARYPGQLRALFTPQHGLWGEQQANMIETPHARHRRLDVPIYSLYSETRQPTAEMLAELDCLVVDLPDVGTRVYTYAWTVLNCLRVCAELALPILLLDRPNPLGRDSEGPCLEPPFRSFVGGACIPMRHGLTLGELAAWLNRSEQIGADLQVVAVEGWDPRELFPVLRMPWVPPSPNLPTFDSALVYPGQVLLEGTAISEGRGTTRPFEICGAPHIDPDLLWEAIAAYDLPGVAFLPIRFTPGFDKWAGESCGGVSLHVTDPATFRPYRVTLALLAAIKQLWPGDFQWLQPPYEYETQRMPIDILAGSDRLRRWLDSGGQWELCPGEVCEVDDAGWQAATWESRLY